MLLVFKRSVTMTTHRPTEAGERERSRLREVLDQAPEIRHLLDRDPARAAAMAAALGPLIFLVPALLPLIDRLAAVADVQSTQFIGDSSGNDAAWKSLTEVNGAMDGALESAASSHGDGGSDGNGGSEAGGK